MYDYGFRDYSPVSARFTTVDPIRDGSNWFSYVVNDPVNYVDPFGLSSTDRSGWSNVKSTVKGWGESIKSDLIQTCNDIKGVVSNALSNTKAIVSNFMNNAGKAITAWTTQAKASVNKTWSDIRAVGNDMIESFFKAIVRTGVNLLGGDSTKNIYNSELNETFNGLPTKDGDDYGVSEGLKNEIGQTYVQKSEIKLIDVLIADLGGKNSILGNHYFVDVRKNHGFSDMETAIGKYEATVVDVNLSEIDKTVTLRINTYDTFDFDPQVEENRPGFNEFVTWLANQAGLGSPVTIIDVNYELTFRYTTDEKGAKIYSYVE